MRNLGILCGIFGLTGVLLGAFGAHALRDLLLEHGTANSWDTAVRHQLVHAVALLVVSRTASNGPAPAGGTGRDWLRCAGRCWSTGILLFSGSLYGYALGGSHALVYVTPLGGLMLLLGWGAVIVHFVISPARPGPGGGGPKS
ncbi:MAG: DUF423 domain-containing protein [Opitutaceae bacterium]|nr:DUF423 domain-containing protein [Opitutaceae bacterium]